MSMCRVVSCAVWRGCLLCPTHSLGKTLLAFVLIHSVLQDQPCLLLQVSLDFLLLHSSPLWWKWHLFLVLVLDLIALHRTVQLLWHYWSGHTLGLLWYWMVCAGNEQRSFCHFWDCTQVLHSWVRKIPWRRKWQTTPVFLPGESHGQRSLAGYSPRGRKESVRHDWVTSLSLPLYVWFSSIPYVWSENFLLIESLDNHRPYFLCFLSLMDHAFVWSNVLCPVLCPVSLDNRFLYSV